MPRKTPRWRGSIHTPRTQRNTRRRLNRKIAHASDVIARMRAFGAVLRLQYRAGRAIWWLEPGGEIEEAAAVAVVVSNSVTPVDPGLFPDLNCPAQTYKLVL